MTEWKSPNPTSSSSQSSIAAMKNFLADGRLTPLSPLPPPPLTLAHPPTTHIPHTRPGVGIDKKPNTVLTEQYRQTARQ